MRKLLLTFFLLIFAGLSLAADDVRLSDISTQISNLGKVYLYANTWVGEKRIATGHLNVGTDGAGDLTGFQFKVSVLGIGIDEIFTYSDLENSDSRTYYADKGMTKHLLTLKAYGYTFTPSGGIISISYDEVGKGRVKKQLKLDLKRKGEKLLVLENGKYVPFSNLKIVGSFAGETKGQMYKASFY